MQSKGPTVCDPDDPNPMVFYSNRVDRTPRPLTMAEAASLSLGSGWTVTQLPGFYKVERTSTDIRYFALYSATRAGSVPHHFGIPVSDYQAGEPMTPIGLGAVKKMQTTDSGVIREIILETHGHPFHIHLCEMTWPAT